MKGRIDFSHRLWRIQNGEATIGRYSEWNEERHESEMKKGDIYYLFFILDFFEVFRFFLSFSPSYLVNMPIYYQHFCDMSSIFYINICIISVISFCLFLFLATLKFRSCYISFIVLFRQIVSFHKKRRPEILSVGFQSFVLLFSIFPGQYHMGCRFSPVLLFLLSDRSDTWRPFSQSLLLPA